MQLQESLRLFSACQSDLGESPVWDETSNTLLFVDISRGQICTHCLSPLPDTACQPLSWRTFPPPVISTVSACLLRVFAGIGSRRFEAFSASGIEQITTRRFG